MEDVILKKNYLGACRATNQVQLLKDREGNLLPFKDQRSVIFVVCSSCQNLFEADRERADNLLFAASQFARIRQQEFPQSLLEDNCDCAGYYLEISNCLVCVGDQKETYCFVKKISD